MRTNWVKIYILPMKLQEENKDIIEETIGRESLGKDKLAFSMS